MPGGFQLFNLSYTAIIGEDLTTAGGTGVAPSASANVKGSWTQLIAATTVDAVWIEISIGPCFLLTAATSTALDIGVGASGSEIPIINNLMVVRGDTSVKNAPQQTRYAFPCNIPAGTRIAGRVQTSGASSTTCLVTISIYSGAFPQSSGCGFVDSLGFSAATTLGTNLSTPGGTKAKGAFTQITAATPTDYLGFFFTLDCRNGNPPEFGAQVDVAVGSSGSEKIIYGGFISSSVSATALLLLAPIHSPFVPTQIPVGSRITARYSAETSVNQLGLTFYGVY